MDETVPTVQRLSLCQKAKLLTPIVVCNCPMTIKVYRMSIKGHGVLIKGYRMSFKLQVKSIVDVDVDSERLQNRYAQTESHLLQSTAAADPRQGRRHSRGRGA